MILINETRIWQVKWKPFSTFSVLNPGSDLWLCTINILGIDRCIQAYKVVTIGFTGLTHLPTRLTTVFFAARDTHANATSPRQPSDH